MYSKRFQEMYDDFHDDYFEILRSPVVEWYSANYDIYSFYNFIVVSVHHLLYNLYLLTFSRTNNGRTVAQRIYSTSSERSITRSTP